MASDPEQTADAVWHMEAAKLVDHWRRPDRQDTEYAVLESIDDPPGLLNTAVRART